MAKSFSVETGVPRPDVEVPFDLTGAKINMLTVIERAPNVSSGSAWVCRCDCGGLTTVSRNNLLREQVKSCGCLRKKMSGDRARIHGKSKTSTYTTWVRMRDRCYNSNNEHYADYGGRGITVCDQWKESFEAFLADMGERPAYKTLDRKNRDGNYEKDNCRWATQKEQMRNKKNNAVFEGKTIAEWAEITGIHQATLAWRLRTWKTIWKEK